MRCTLIYSLVLKVPRMSAPAHASVPTLLVDLGGTNVRFGVADPSLREPLLPGSVRRYRVAEHESLVATARRRTQCRRRSWGSAASEIARHRSSRGPGTPALT